MCAVGSGEAWNQNIQNQTLITTTKRKLLDIYGGKLYWKSIKWARDTGEELRRVEEEEAITAESETSFIRRAILPGGK